VCVCWSRGRCRPSCVISCCRERCHRRGCPLLSTHPTSREAGVLALQLIRHSQTSDGSIIRIPISTAHGSRNILTPHHQPPFVRSATSSAINVCNKRNAVCHDLLYHLCVGETTGSLSNGLHICHVCPGNPFYSHCLTISITRNTLFAAAATICFAPTFYGAFASIPWLLFYKEMCVFLAGANLPVSQLCPLAVSLPNYRFCEWLEWLWNLHEDVGFHVFGFVF
jgi:hypothetical protein